MTVRVPAREERKRLGHSVTRPLATCPHGAPTRLSTRLSYTHFGPVAEPCHQEWPVWLFKEDSGPTVSHLAPTSQGPSITPTQLAKLPSLAPPQSPPPMCPKRQKEAKSLNRTFPVTKTASLVHGEARDPAES